MLHNCHIIFLAPRPAVRPGGQGPNLRTCPHMPPPGHVWACVLFRGACVLGSRVLEGGMCGACVLFGNFLLKSRKNFACGAHNPGGNPPDPPRSQNGHVYFEIPNPSTGAKEGSERKKVELVIFLAIASRILPNAN